MSTNLKVIGTGLKTLRQQHKKRAFQTLCSRLGLVQSPGEWLTVTRDMVSDFKRATGESDANQGDATLRSRQYLVPPHMVLSCMDAMTGEDSPIMDNNLVCRGMKQLVDCGYERVNFTSPLPADVRIRAEQTLTTVTLHTNSIEAKIEVIVESEVDDTPVCVAERIFQLEF